MLKSLIQSPWNQWKCSHWLQGALPQALHGSSCHATRALGSAQRCGSGRLSTPHPLGRHAGTGVGILPRPLTYAPPRLRKKMGNSTSVLESLYVFTSSRSTAGRGDSATLVWSPTSPPPSPPAAPVCHRCLRHRGVSGPHRRCSPCTST